MSDTAGIASSDDIALFQSVRSAMATVHEAVGVKVRSQHPKAHGVVQAVFQVQSVPEAYRVGVFAQAQCFAAWIRFSNGRETDDRKPDVRGMAIKLLGVSGEKLTPDESSDETHDFVLASHPIFFAKDAKHFLQFLGMKGAQGVEFKKDLYDKDLRFIKAFLKASIAKSLWGNEGSVRVMLMVDNQFQKAFELFPEAEKISKNITSLK